MRGGADTAAGVSVDQSTALEYGPFFAGLRVISEDIASLPLPVYERLDPRGKRRARDHPLYPLLHDAPNPLMGSMQFRETLQGHALTWGDGVAYVVRNGSGQVTEMWPLRPDRLTIETATDQRGRIRVLYRYRDPVNNIQADLLPDEVLHVHGLGFDGIRGYSVVHLARQSIGLGMATERYGASFFGNGSRPGGVLEHPGRVTDQARERMRTDWENLHKGLDRSQRVAILEEGVTWRQVGVPPEDAQFLETRRLQVTEAARWLRLPPHKIGDLERATFSNIESQQIDYVSSALRSWLVRWEQAINTQLLLAADRQRFFAEHLVDGLLRGDIQTRFQAYSIARQWGWMSADDIREKENENPLPDRRGETYLVPLNMVPAPAPGEQTEEPGRASTAMARQLRSRSTEGRRRIGESFKPMLADADERIAKLERSEVGALASKHLERSRSADAFVAAVRELYEDRIADRTSKAFTPVISSLVSEVAADAVADVGGDEDVDLERWVTSYVASHVDYRIGSAVGQLAKLAGADDPTESVRQRLDKWVDERPERTARWESNQAANGAAREAWRSSGVRRLRWVTVGEDCPFCDSLDGTVVAIEQPFREKDSAVTGLEEKLDIARDTFHPPLHPGCDCQIVPD
nr:phage portal protein [Haloechinothrix aidingensis]